MSWRNGSKVWSDYPLSKNSQKDSSFPFLGSLPMRGSTFPRKGTKFLSSNRRLRYSQIKAIFRHTFAANIGSTSRARPKIPKSSIASKRKGQTCMLNRGGGRPKWRRAVISTKITKYARRRNRSRSFPSLAPNSQRKNYSTYRTPTSVSTLSERLNLIPYLRCSSTAKPFKKKVESISSIGPPFNCHPSRISTVNMSKIGSKNQGVDFRARTSVRSWSLRTRDAVAKENILRGSTCLTV